MYFFFAHPLETDFGCFNSPFSNVFKDIMMLKAAKKMAHTCYNYKTGKDPIDRLTVVWNKIQTKFECCGINSYQDWKNSTFGKTGIIRIYNLQYILIIGQPERQ